MSIATNLHGRLRNTILPATNGLLPLFEAVVNSIHAIEEAGISTDEGNIIVNINRQESTAELDYADLHKRPGPDPLDNICKISKHLTAPSQNT
ncbi:MAG: hypothetical protein ACYC63_21785 [Armatimonadota bacterium]